MAAKRSREAKRLKENQIALKTAYLEGNNDILKKALDKVNFKNEKLVEENEMLRERSSRYENAAAEELKAI